MASLPESNADEEDSSVADILGKGDFLAMLREQMARLQRHNPAAFNNEDDEEEAAEDDDEELEADEDEDEGIEDDDEVEELYD